ncbi:hypothetical protein ABTZ03_31490 [Kitasatospora sp. NPDC096077]
MPLTWAQAMRPCPVLPVPSPEMYVNVSPGLWEASSWTAARV